MRVIAQLVPTMQANTAAPHAVVASAQAHTSTIRLARLDVLVRAAGCRALGAARCRVVRPGETGAHVAAAGLARKPSPSVGTDLPGSLAGSSAQMIPTDVPMPAVGTVR